MNEIVSLFSRGEVAVVASGLRPYKQMLHAAAAAKMRTTQRYSMVDKQSPTAEGWTCRSQNAIRLFSAVRLSCCAERRFQRAVKQLSTHLPPNTKTTLLA